MKARKKAKFKKRYWLLAGLVIVILILVLSLYRPARYNPLELAPAGGKPGQVSRYLTHQFLPQLYNGAQRGEPFDLPVSQKGINEIIAWSEWPKEFDGIRFSAPVVLFVPDSIILMGTVNIKGVEFVVTIVAEAGVDEQGLLNLWVAKVKVGAVNITLLARVMAKTMYAQRLATTPIDRQDLQAQIAASILNDEPFEPVFEVEDKKVRVEKITIEQEKLTIRLIPVPG